MVQRWVTVFLILCVGWQLLAFAGFGALLAHEKQEQHELLHFQGAAHHHDDHAEDFHEDDSSASVVHVALDSSQFSPALPSPLGPPQGLSGVDRLTFERLMALAESIPDGLDRPPKFLV